ncbi:MAG: epimerase, partial [Planctomycetota bacterium]
LARLAVEQGRQSENLIVNAIGPEVFTYRDLVHQIGIIIGKKRPIISLPDSICYYIGNIIGMIMKDVVVTHEEIEGLKANLLFTDDLPEGQTKLTDWAKRNVEILGLRYANELTRRRNRLESYDKL